jgi:hypothetical protein
VLADRKKILGLHCAGVQVSTSPRDLEAMLMSGSRAIKYHPIITFFVLTYVITWGFVPFGSFGAFA